MSAALVDELPGAWKRAPLAEVATLVRGVSYKKDDARMSLASGFVPVLRATNITGSALTFAELVYVPSNYVSDVQYLRSGDIAIASSSGSKEIVGKAGQVLGDPQGCSFGAFCTVLRPACEFNARYLGYYLESPGYREAISEISAGSNINNIKSSELSAHVVPVAAVEEQTRIVEKLEELLSELDAGVAELKAAQRKLARYRQSLLKSAVEGALTADWREDRIQRGETQETGAELLQRILVERRVRWEAKQLAKFALQGKTPPKDWQAKYPEPKAPNASDLPTLPEGWVWASVDQLSPDDLANGRSVPTADVGAKVLRLTAVKDGRIDLNEWKIGAWSEDEAEAFAVVEGDLLVIRGNGSLSLVGRAGLVAGVTTKVAYPDTLIRLRLLENIVRPEWIARMWDTSLTRAHLERRARTSAGIYKISQPDIISVLVPVPPLSEQLQILSLLEREDEHNNSVLETLGMGLKQAAAQRKNILKAAFAGQLVAQDPDDEPASVLLDRIRAERAARGESGAKRGRKAKASA